MNRLILVFLLLLASCTTVKYVMVDPKDSTKLVEIRKRIVYDDIYYSPNLMVSPFYYNWYTRPYYYTPRIYVAPQPRIENRPRQADPFPKPPIPHQAPIRQFPNQPNRRN